MHCPASAVEQVMDPLLQATGLVKVYHSVRGGTAKTAVSDVSLTLSPGNCLGIVGESGCGKSTLARLLVGLDRPTAGTIELEGEPIHARSTADRRALARRIQL